MPRVFISHSSLDSGFVEREIIPLLTSHGIESWYSKDSIASAAEWEKEIKVGLKACDWFLVVMSPYAAASDWVRCEVDWAVDERKGKVIPILYRTCDPTDLHLKLRRIQFIDFRYNADSAQDKLLAIWGLCSLAVTDKEELAVSRESADSERIETLNQEVAIDGEVSHSSVSQINSAAAGVSEVHVFGAILARLSERVRGAKWLICGIALCLFLSIVIGIYIQSRLSFKSLEARLENTIAANNIFPPGENAFELYQQLKSSGVAQSSLTHFNDELIPVLSAPVEPLLPDLSDPTKPPEAEVKDWERAAKYLEWATEIKPNDSKLVARRFYCYGAIAYRNGNYAQAISHFSRARAEDNSWACPLNRLGSVYSQQRDYVQAKSYFVEAITREPSWAVPYQNLANLYYYQKDFDQAESFYRQAGKLAVRWGHPHAALADIAMRRGDYLTAIKEYQTVLDLGDPTIRLDVIRTSLERAKNVIKK